MPESAHHYPWGLRLVMTCNSGCHEWCEVHLGKSLPFSLSLLPYLKLEVTKVLSISSCPGRPQCSSWGTRSTRVNLSPPCPPPPNLARSPRNWGWDSGSLWKHAGERAGTFVFPAPPQPLELLEEPGYTWGWDEQHLSWSEGLLASP